MRVANVITSDLGGGGRAAYRLNLGLKRAGCESVLFLASKHYADPETVVFQPRTDVAARLRRTLFRWRSAMRPSNELWDWDHECQRGDEAVAQIPDADVVNLHTIGNFFNYAAYFSPKNRIKPTVWTIHVMSPFTGGCSYTHGCERFTASCGACPILDSSSPDDLSRKVWESKKRIYASVPKEKLTLVAPSRWMAAEIGASSLMREFRVEVIPNGLDLNVYAPRDRSVAREALGLPPRARVVLFVTQHALGVKVKGFAKLLDALKEMKGVPDLHLLTLGSGDFEQLGIPHTHLGHVFNDNLLSIVYSAADLFVIPSLMDNLPNVVMESLACGTPVVGFQTGGIPEMIIPGQTGELAPAGDVRALREVMEALLIDEPRRAAMSTEARKSAVDRYSIERQGARYKELYENML